MRLAAALAVHLTAQVGGVFPLDSTLAERWPVASTWCWPVGDPARFGAPRTADEPAFTTLRGVTWSRGRATHQGADLADGRGGDPVCAAAAGIVALAYDGDNGNGYGGHVLVAHRLAEGGEIYTVYAHLASGSLAVRAGDLVAAGDAIGRVGQTGRASCPHLHFEVREPRTLDERWEHARVLEPLGFVEERLASPPSPSVAQDDAIDVGRRYVRWAVESGLVAARVEPETSLTRGAWWRMLALAVAGGPEQVDVAPEALRDTLMEAGLLPEEEAGAPADERLAWAEAARDVKRLRQFGVRLAHGPLGADAHAAACETRLGQRAPAAHTSALKRRDDEPRLADACLLVADVSGPRPDAEYGRADRQPSRAAKLHRSTHGKKHPAAKKPAKAKRVKSRAKAGAAKPSTPARGVR